MWAIEINTKTGIVTERDCTTDELLMIEQLKSIDFEVSYNKKVVELIREKYSIDDELAIHRQRETKPNEFNEYFNYCEECKLKYKQ